MYLFHSHNIVGCLASIGDSDKMIHIPKEVHLSFSLSQSSQTISTVAFLFSVTHFFCVQHYG